MDKQTANRKRVVKVIFEAIDEFNHELTEEQQLEKSANTVLFGKSGKLDSLGLVTFIVAVEEKLQEGFEVALTLADERAMSQEKSPFRTIGTLSNYVSLLLEEIANE